MDFKKPSKQLYNLELARSKFSKEILFRNIDYALAVLKKKQLISQGTMARNIWIVKAK